MARAVEILLSQPLFLALVIVGVSTGFATVALAARAVKRLGAESNRLLDLAQAGRADEARILARRGTRDLAPLLAALGGVLSPPSPRPLVRDLFGVGLVFLFPALAVLAGWQASLRPVASDRIAGLTAGLLSVGILLPTALAAATLIVTFGRRGARKVRGAAVQLLARSVKSAVDADFMDGLRRGVHRDPRGE